jgi:hypothetical protein
MAAWRQQDQTALRGHRSKGPADINIDGAALVAACAAAPGRMEIGVAVHDQSLQPGQALCACACMPASMQAWSK